MTIDEIIEAAQADYFWAPDDVNLMIRPEITYAWADRDGSVFNSVVRVRPALGVPEQLVAEVAERHLGHASRWCLSAMGDTSEMRRALTAAGYVKGHGHHAYSIRPREYSRVLPANVQVRRVSSVEQLRHSYEVRADVFGLKPDVAESEMGRELQACSGQQSRAARFVAYIDGAPVGGGDMSFFDDLDFALLWAGGVREAFRGQGVYTALLHARLQVARCRGIGLLGLYARDTTSGPIVAGHGFARHGRMIHWNRPA